MTPLLPAFFAGLARPGKESSWEDGFVGASEVVDLPKSSLGAKVLVVGMPFAVVAGAGFFLGGEEMRFSFPWPREAVLLDCEEEREFEKLDAGAGAAVAPKDAGAGSFDVGVLRLPAVGAGMPRFRCCGCCCC